VILVELSCALQNDRVGARFIGNRTIRLLIRPREDKQPDVVIMDINLPGMTGIEGVRAGRSIADVERDLIIATLEHFNGDKKAAATSLGVSLKTLYNRLKEYGNGES